MKTLVIRHIPDSEPPEFQIARGDQKSVKPAKVTPPFGFPVEGRRKSDLIQELHWYLEEFLEYPFSPNTDRAHHVLEAMETWGKQAFNDLFNTRDAGVMFDEATKDGYQNLRLQIMSDDANILQWPWEALLDPKAAYLAVSCQIERRLNEVLDPMEISEQLPTDQVNILLVTARPKKRDIGYRSISRPLVELIETNKIPATVHVLRPPTFDNLRNHLKKRPHFYHIVHFDGHGGYGQSELAGDTQNRFVGPTGVLLFENEKGEKDEITAEQLSGLLRDNAVPIMVLNACQSAMIDEQAEDPFASVAAALIKAGIRGVVAMSYSLYVSAAQEFLPAFYRELFDSGDLSQATRAGRQKMFGQQERVCARGRYELKDFVVPVIYQQESYDLSFAGAVAKAKPVEKGELPDEAQDKANPYGFIGRDRELLKLERAIRKDTPAVLIHGLGGIGKTTLARGFVSWLNDTGGLDGCFWLTFIDIRSAEYVINSMGSEIFGPNFLTAEMSQKIEALADALRENRVIVVWDNFEVVAGIEDTHVSANLSAEDQGILLSLLKIIRGGKSKVLIISRSDEEWMGVEQRMKVSIGGLVGEERWEYCDKILDNLGIAVNREDKDQVELMELLDGHPLAMRVILPKMEKKTAGQIITALQSNIEALEIDQEIGDEQKKFFATLQFTKDQLADDLKPLLVPLALHEQFVDANLLGGMAKQVDKEWTREKIDRFCGALSAAGLFRDIGQNTFELHPALTGFLRSTALKSTTEKIRDVWSRVFVDVMGGLADQLAPLELHEKRPWFHLFGANFHFALAEAKRLKMNTHVSALMQSLGQYAYQTRDFAEAKVLFEQLAEIERKAGNEENEAAAYHQLGIISYDQRDFAGAEDWYQKSLAITEKLDIDHGAATTYHQLGVIAEEQRDFATAENWYQKSLAIERKLGNELGAAKSYHTLGSIAFERGKLEDAKELCIKSLTINERLGDEYTTPMTYHQMGIIAGEQGDFATAQKWYHKSLVITEKLGIDHDAAATYHQLGMIAGEQRDFAAAEKWYHKSLAIEEKQGNEFGAAQTYHQLGMIAQEQRDFATAEKWYLKAVAIDEKQGNEFGAATTYGQLGIMARLQERFEESGKWLIKSLSVFIRSNDPESVKEIRGNFVIIYKNASKEKKTKLKAMWEEAGLGELPSE